MSSRSHTSTGRSLLRLAVVGAVATGVPLALAGTASAAPESAWDKLAQCESGGNWKINSGNGYYGGIQFNATTWRAFGGSGMPHQASKSEQIAVAERTLAAQGWNAWPACSRKMGLHGIAAEPGKKAAPSAKKASAPAKSSAKSSGKSGGSYVVKRGDTLSKIAKAHGTTVAALVSANGLSNAHVLKVGRGLKV
ncbi:LysM peptidoglycan-binding domain-containing protein [Pseudonocardia charpentierae]|uniref:Transglycosylase family protein n=1 Tax=Pseudonocardia charpentierae TaxID=3075545 RepID=A0ABU2NBE2_9PSEU|nr:transglycosylase family protein [Pseudonocardia sp. DSM 45834]MDT0350803.1 transglycosylase family protein [Pseudonocardia sp. DSM 45834]